MAQWRILVIDDDPGTLEIINMALQDAYEVVTLSNPLEALNVCRLFEPDLILLDLMIPKLNGFHLLDIFRRDKLLRNIPVIIISARSNKRDIQRGYSAGAALYLVKPFQPARLRRNIDFFFENTPPPRRVKHLSFSQVYAQIHLLRCYREGTIGFPNAIVTQEGLQKEGDRLLERPAPSKTPPQTKPTKAPPSAEKTKPEREQEEEKERDLWIT